MLRVYMFRECDIEEVCCAWIEKCKKCDTEKGEICCTYMENVTQIAGECYTYIVNVKQRVVIDVCYSCIENVILRGFGMLYVYRYCDIRVRGDMLNVYMYRE